MSFYTIKDPKKRDKEVKEYIALRDGMRDRNRAEKMGEIDRKEALSKIFEPVTGAISKQEETIDKRLKELPGSIIQALPPTPQLPELEGAVGGEPELEGAVGGEEKPRIITVPDDQELTDFSGHLLNNNYPKLINFSPEKKFIINNKKLKITKNKIKYEGKEFDRTFELLDLIFSNNPSEKSLNNKKASDDYGQILFDSGVLFSVDRQGRLAQNKSLSNKPKWNYLKRYYDKYRNQELERRQQQQEQPGGGIKNVDNKTIILPSNPDAIVDRLNLLYSSAQAGNTGLKNEMVEICNELIRQKIIKRKDRDTLLHDV